jgi:hypothetical protein
VSAYLLLKQSLLKPLRQGLAYFRSRHPHFIKCVPVIKTKSVETVTPESEAISSPLQQSKRFFGGGLELRIEVMGSRHGPVLQAWCIGNTPDIHRVCYKVHHVTEYFKEQGVPEEFGRDVLAYVSRLYRKEKEYYKGIAQSP